MVAAQFYEKKTIYMSKCEYRFLHENAGPTVCTSGMGNVIVFEKCWKHRPQGVGECISITPPVNSVTNGSIFSRNYRHGEIHLRPRKAIRDLSHMFGIG